jgi:hypothetical protein
MHHVSRFAGVDPDSTDRGQPFEGPSSQREGPVVATTAARARASGPRRIRVQGMSLRRWLRTTPGRLRTASVVLLLGLLIVGIVAGVAANARGNAARAVGLDAVPELVATEDLYGSLADADATASIIFLKAGGEAPALRERYERDIREAGNHLAAVAREVSSSAQERAAVNTIAKQLPIYTGFVETARANSRLGQPVGAAYLNAASALMRDEILPAATTVYEHAATRLDDEYQSGTSTTEIVLVVVAGTVVLGLLIAVQLLVRRRSNRILNIGLAGATVVVVILLGWTVVRFVSAQSSLVDAQQKGSDTVQLLSAARILTLQAQADENTTLIERGGGAAYVEDFERVTKRLGGTDGRGGLLGEARDVARRTGSEARLDPITKSFVTFTALHDDIREADDVKGDYQTAVTTATDQQAAVIQQLDHDLTVEIDAAKQRLDDHASAARSGFTALAIAIPILLVLAGILVFGGLNQRIKEY